MRRKLNFQTTCLILLLIAETTQGLTPDPASVASTRLLRMIGAGLKRGESWTLCCLNRTSDLIRSESTDVPGPSHPLPWESTEPDEVCLAWFLTASVLAGASASEAHFAVRFILRPQSLPISSNWFILSVFSHSAGKNHSLLDSICRLTC